MVILSTAIDHMNIVLLYITVYIGHKEVAVYQDDSCKPPQGEGLNKRATITLENTWPLDKTTRQQIKVVMSRLALC